MMSRMIWIGLVFALVLPMGCIEIGEETERECLSDRRCGVDEQPVCGTDGTTYDCESMALCYGVQVDPSEDACESQQTQCEPVTCELYCENGFDTDGDGCEICQCNDQEPCPGIPCDEECPNGYKTDENGCQLCECREEVQCEGVSCTLYCENGFKTDENGCEYCECREEGDRCGDDPCVSDYCESRQAECMRESELATMGPCGLTDYVFYEPEPECVCSEDSCDKRGCFTDSECQSAEALCVTGPDPGEGYCVQASCQDLIDSYDQVITQRRQCATNSDCKIHYPAHECCSSSAVNADGKTELEAIDRFASNTTCGRDWNAQCADISCPPQEPVSPECHQGTCRLTSP